MTAGIISQACNGLLEYLQQVKPGQQAVLNHLVAVLVLGLREHVSGH